MKYANMILGACVLLLALGRAADAGESYEASLQAGDDHRNAREPELAVKEFDIAVTQAANETQQSLALGKRAYVFAYELKNFAAARESAEKALALPGVEPVAEVTALQVLAECQLRADQDFAAAARTLEQASALAGVDWAQPTIALMLGDSYRLGGQFEDGLAAYRRLLDLPGADTGIKALAHLNIGLTYQYSRPDPGEARAAYAQAVALNPSLQKEVDGHLAKLP